MTVFDGIVARIVETSRLAVNILERSADDPRTPDERTVVFVHGNVSSALFWQEIMQDLPGECDFLLLGQTRLIPVGIAG